MEGGGNEDVNKKISQEDIEQIKENIIEPTEQIIALSTPLPSGKIKHAPNVYRYLYMSKHELKNFKDVLENNRYSINKTEVEEVIKVLQANILLLEERIKIYYHSVEEQNQQINIPTIKQKLNNPKTFDSLVEKITLRYEYPLNNTTYGNVIRSTLVALEKLQSTNDLTVLKEHIKKCEHELKAAKEQTELLSDDDFPIQKEELLKVQESLSNLLEVCRLVKM